MARCSSATSATSSSRGTAEPWSVLHPDINGGSLDGILAVHSLSKRSNLAGYRDAFVTGDQAVVAELLAVRKHLGFMVPAPVQAAMTAALADDAHVDEQRARYAARRRPPDGAESAGFTVDHSQGCALPVGHPRRALPRHVDWLAERGILVAPGDFYGPPGARTSGSPSPPPTSASPPRSPRLARLTADPDHRRRRAAPAGWPWSRRASRRRMAGSTGCLSNADRGIWRRVAFPTGNGRGPSREPPRRSSASRQRDGAR